MFFMNFIAFLSENHCFLNEVSAKVLESNGARLDYNRTVRLAAVAASDWRDLFTFLSENHCFLKEVSAKALK